MLVEFSCIIDIDAIFELKIYSYSTLKDVGGNTTINADPGRLTLNNIIKDIEIFPQQQKY